MISSINFKQAGIVTGALALATVASLAAYRIASAVYNRFFAPVDPATALAQAQKAVLAAQSNPAAFAEAEKAVLAAQKAVEAQEKALDPAKILAESAEVMKLAEENNDQVKAEEAVELAKKAKQAPKKGMKLAAIFVSLLASAGLFFANKTGLISLGNLASRVSNFRN